ncbi:hypothetical protein EBR77_03245 [bacterium]|nr:hypothetical protein [bacterium]NBX78315.1 hypothetical protein [bacterium]
MTIRFVVLLVTLSCVSVHASGDRVPGAFSMQSAPAEMTAVPTAIVDFVRSDESERNQFLVKLLRDLCKAQKSTRFGGLSECLERRQLLGIIQTLSDSAQIQLTKSSKLEEQVVELELKNIRLCMCIQSLQEFIRPQVFQEDTTLRDLFSPIQTEENDMYFDEPVDSSDE